MILACSYIKNLIEHYSLKLAIQLYALVASSIYDAVCGGSVGLRPATWIPFSMIGNYAEPELEKPDRYVAT